MQVTFAHGLLGDKSFPYEPETFTKGTLNAVREAAQEEHLHFMAPEYQWIQDQFRYPTLTGMSNLFIGDIDAALCGKGSVDHSKNGDLWVGSSVGAIVMLQAMMELTSAKDMILFKPIYDMVWAATMMMGGKEKAEAYFAEKDIFSIPVASTEVGGDQGVFPLRKQHLRDDSALQFLNNPKSAVADFDKAMRGQKIQNMQIICAENDPLSSPALAETFKTIVQPLVANPVEIAMISGDHGTDHSAFLKDQIKTKLAAGWGRHPA